MNIRETLKDSVSYKDDRIGKHYTGTSLAYASQHTLRGTYIHYNLRLVRSVIMDSVFFRCMMSPQGMQKIRHFRI